jgi:hypothetical protein
MVRDISLDHLLRALQSETVKVAHEALVSPKPDLFSYGRACGYHAGLKRAEQMLLQMVSDMEKDQ